MASSEGKYVQYGAGYTAPPGWLSFDASPTLRIQKLPVVGKMLARLSGNADPFPDALRVGDIIRGLPVPAGSVKGLYASHVLEHLSLEDMRTALRHSFELLEPGGVFRLIVPDLLERARRYVSGAEKGDREAAMTFMESLYMGAETRPRGMRGRLRTLIGNSAHLWMWDYESMALELERAGFVDIRPAKLGDSGIEMFDRVEDAGRFFDNGIAEVAIQAKKP